MFKIISDLQSKPESYKKKVALFFSTFFILVVITLWVTFIVLKVDTTLGLNEEEWVIKVDDVDSPIESLKSSLGASIESLKTLFEGSTTYP